MEEQQWLDKLINATKKNRGILEGKSASYRIVIEKEECPICGSIVNKDFESKVQHLISEERPIVSEINQYNHQKKECKENIDKLNAYHNQTEEIECYRSLYKKVTGEMQDDIKKNNQTKPAKTRY